MSWEKSNPELVDRFDALVPAAPGVERRQMFGYPCCFVNGNLFMGLYQQSMMLRLSDADRPDFLRREGSGPFEPMPGRPMKEYALVPPDMLSRDDELKAWIARSLDYAASLPVKEKKPPKSKKPAPA